MPGGLISDFGDQPFYFIESDFVVKKRFDVNIKAYS